MFVLYIILHGLLHRAATSRIGVYSDLGGDGLPLCTMVSTYPPVMELFFDSRPKAGGLDRRLPHMGSETLRGMESTSDPTE